MQRTFAWDQENPHPYCLRNLCRCTKINVSAAQPALSDCGSRSPMDDSSTFTSEKKVAQCLKLLPPWLGPLSDCEGSYFQCPENLSACRPPQDARVCVCSMDAATPDTNNVRKRWRSQITKDLLRCAQEGEIFLDETTVDEVLMQHFEPDIKCKSQVDKHWIVHPPQIFRALERSFTVWWRSWPKSCQ